MLTIFNVNGTMTKTQKSKLVDALNMEVINPAPNEYIAMLDMGIYRKVTIYLA